MSEMLDDILAKNFLNLAVSEAMFPSPSPLAIPEKARLNRSTSFFSPSSQTSSSSLSLSSEHVDSEENGSSLWSSNIWSQVPLPSQKQSPFRPDRSMSLTESSLNLLSTFEQLKNRELLPPGSATTVAPPPGFPPSSNLLGQVPPMLSSNRYKTELCRGFQETGSCKYGSKCQFAHGEAELRGLYRHPKYKTEPCRTFYNFGYCPYGPRCHFIHEEKISGAQPASNKFQRQPISSSASSHNPRQPLRQSLSFAGFMGSSRSSPPPSFPSTFSEMAFSRAPSVSPPPDLLSPVFGDSAPRQGAAFQFGNPHTRASTGDIQSIPLLLESKGSHCVCGHGNKFNNSHFFSSLEDEPQQDSAVRFSNFGNQGGIVKPPGLQRFSSEDSLEDSYSSSSSSSSSGSESPTFDGSASKRLTVFERLSVSD